MSLKARIIMKTFSIIMRTIMIVAHVIIALLGVYYCIENPQHHTLIDNIGFICIVESFLACLTFMLWEESKGHINREYNYAYKIVIQDPIDSVEYPNYTERYLSNYKPKYIKEMAKECPYMIGNIVSISRCFYDEDYKSIEDAEDYARKTWSWRAKEDDNIPEVVWAEEGLNSK